MASNSRGAADVVPAFQRAVERLAECADKNFTQFEDKSQAVHVGRKTPGNGTGGSLSVEGVDVLKKPLGVLVGCELGLRQQ